MAQARTNAARLALEKIARARAALDRRLRAAERAYERASPRQRGAQKRVELRLRKEVARERARLTREEKKIPRPRARPTAAERRERTAVRSEVEQIALDRRAIATRVVRARRAFDKAENTFRGARKRDLNRVEEKARRELAVLRRREKKLAPRVVREEERAPRAPTAVASVSSSVLPPPRAAAPPPRERLVAPPLPKHFTEDDVAAEQTLIWMQAELRRMAEELGARSWTHLYPASRSVAGRLAIQPIPRDLRELTKAINLATDPMRAALDFRSTYFAVRVRADEVKGETHESSGEVSRTRSGGIVSHYFHSHYFRGQDTDGRQTGLFRLADTLEGILRRLRRSTPYNVTQVEILFAWNPGGVRPARPERPRDRRGD